MFTCLFPRNKNSFIRIKSLFLVFPLFTCCRALVTSVGAFIDTRYGKDVFSGTGSRLQTPPDVASGPKTSFVSCVTQRAFSYPFKEILDFRDSKMPVFLHFNIFDTGMCCKSVHFTLGVNWGHVLGGCLEHLVYFVPTANNFSSG